MKIIKENKANPNYKELFNKILLDDLINYIQNPYVFLKYIFKKTFLILSYNKTKRINYNFNFYLIPENWVYSLLTNLGKVESNDLFSRGAKILAPRIWVSLPL